ncbi:hypothetical protein PCASD_08296 [Puccinia coronata f. sp. avenae]|uniref:Uncharacterized protein n=1 Tax=Puccinia coronata f. sp. avenae TaxID=200324 RepID=A0A2N5V137_9BASI|nr:hypothetical protein PCASD_08296 [Puccinia coronata f. sp. avenae]
MSFLWSDLSHSNPPSSPIPGPSEIRNRHPTNQRNGLVQKQTLQEEQEEDEEETLLGAYPTPPVSENEPLIPRPSSSRHRPRLRTGSSSIRTFPRTYRQATLPECLNRCASSPLGDRNVELEPFDDFERPILAPLLFNNDTRLSKRLKYDDPLTDQNSHQLLPSAQVKEHPTSELDFLDSLSSSPRHHPPRSNRSRILQPACDPMHFELAHKRSDVEPRRMKRIESLRSDPETQTIKMWNPEYDNGQEFPFSLCFNHAAKAGDSGRPPATGELMATASALGTISLYNPSLTGSVEHLMPIATFQGVQNGIFALCFSPSDVMLATGSGAQVSEIFDVETGNVLGRLHDHMGTVKTVEFSSFNEQIIVTGSRDGSIKIWDLRITGTQISQDGSHIYPPVMTIRNAHDEKYTGRKRRKGVHLPSVSAVLWSRIAEHQLFSAGSANGLVKLWDVRKKSPFTSKAHPVPTDQSIEQSGHTFLDDEFEQAVALDNPQRPHGISSLVASSDGARIYSLGTDNTIRTHDGLYLSRPPTSQFRPFRHASMITTSLYLKLCLSSDDRYLGCSSSTGEIFLWDTRLSAPDMGRRCQPAYLEPPARFLDFPTYEDGRATCCGTSLLHNTHHQHPVVLAGHNKEVCGLDFWRQGLGSCSDDSSIRIWSYSDALLFPLSSTADNQY